MGFEKEKLGLQIAHLSRLKEFAMNEKGY